MEVLREGYRIPLSRIPPLSEHPLTLPSYSPSSIKGRALASEVRSLVLKGAVEPAPQSPGFYSRMFIVMKTSGVWRPIIDLSRFNRFVVGTKFRMETVQSVLASVRQGDWMVSLDLKDAYLQVPVHPESRRFLRFSTPEGTFQFKVLCFGLSTSPQVFTRVMAPVSVILHSLGIRMLRYLDDWLILAKSLQECLWARDKVFQLCQELGIQLNLEKSQMVPTQVATYLGMIINSTTLRASPAPKRCSSLLSLIEEFLSFEKQPASLWRSLLGHLASLTRLIPGGRLRMRSLQLVMRRSWDFKDDRVLITWNRQCQEDLLWWSNPDRLTLGCSLSLLSPNLAFWSDASDEGWGAHLAESTVSGLWSMEEKSLSINLRELRAIRLGLSHFAPQIEGQTVAVFSDNSTAVAYLRKEGGTVSPLLNQEAQLILRWTESLGISLIPQFIMGSNNVIADALSRQGQVLGSEWTLCQEVVNILIKRWPSTVDLFATSMNYRLPVYFSPLPDQMSAGTDAFLQKWDHLQAYAFPPFSIIRQVINKIRASQGLELTLIAPFWPQKEWFPDLLECLMEPPLRLPERRDLLKQPHFHRFHLALPGLSLHAWRLSSGSPGMKDSLLRWRNRSPLLAGDPLA